MLEAIDRYKYGIVAAFTCYAFIIVYTNVVSYKYEVPIEPFINQTKIENVEEILEIEPEDIEVPPDYNMVDVKNMSQNVHDDRKASYENYSENRTPEQVAQDIKQLEAQMKQESGGATERAKLQKMIDQRKKEQQAMQNNSSQNSSETLETAPNKYAGQTMVSWDLNGRRAHQNNDYYVRNPGYTCDRANGVVVINVKTNNNGDVISATYNASSSRNATQCMIDQAMMYAKMSRFEYSSEGGKQSGYIKYTFVYK